MNVYPPNILNLSIIALAAIIVLAYILRELRRCKNTTTSIYTQKVMMPTHIDSFYEEFMEVDKVRTRLKGHNFGVTLFKRLDPGSTITTDVTVVRGGDVCQLDIPKDVVDMLTEAIDPVNILNETFNLKGDTRITTLIIRR